MKTRNRYIRLPSYWSFRPMLSDSRWSHLHHWSISNCFATSLCRLQMGGHGVFCPLSLVVERGRRTGAPETWICVNSFSLLSCPLPRGKMRMIVLNSPSLFSVSCLSMNGLAASSYVVSVPKEGTLES